MQGGGGDRCRLRKAIQSHSYTALGSPKASPQHFTSPPASMAPAAAPGAAQRLGDDAAAQPSPLTGACLLAGLVAWLLSGSLHALSTKVPFLPSAKSWNWVLSENLQEREESQHRGLINLMGGCHAAGGSVNMRPKSWHTAETTHFWCQ